jgi:hypothetical protein
MPASNGAQIWAAHRLPVPTKKTVDELADRRALLAR